MFGERSQQDRKLEVKNSVKEMAFLVPYIVGGGFFFVIFIKIPVLCDRWMEGVACYGLENTWRLICTQYFWLKLANGRIFSNLFSIIVDRNIYIRGIVDSLMLMLISYLTVFGYRDKAEMSARKKLILSVVAVSLTALMGWNIKEEVYFYATTLYISSALLVTIIIVLMLRLFWADIREESSVCLYAVLIVSALWLESVSLVATGFCTINVIALYLKRKEINRKALICFGISFAGLLVMYISVKRSQGWRFAYSGKLDFRYALLLFARRNIAIITVFLVVIGFIYHQRFKKGMLHKLVRWILNIIIGFNIILGGENVYQILATDCQNLDPQVNPFGWETIEWEGGFFQGIDFIFENIFFPITVFLIVVLCLLFKEVEEYYECIAVLSTVVISFIGLCKYGLSLGRVEHLTVSLFVFFIIAIFKNISFDTKNHRMRKIITAGVSILLIITFISCDTMYIYCHNAAEIGEKRQRIADLVQDEQLLGHWDYENMVVVMPSYNSTFFGDRANPDKEDGYYPILLKYYKLDKRTQLIFE